MPFSCPLPLLMAGAGLAAFVLLAAGGLPGRSPEPARPVIGPAAGSLGRPGLPPADNPTVAPGLVRWHPSFADACAAAKKSGKPVLAFHMMGQLDRQFC